MSHRLTFLALTFALTLMAPFAHAQIGIQFAFSDRFDDGDAGSLQYTSGADGPAHVVDGLPDDPANNTWNVVGSGEGVTDPVPDATGTLNLINGDPDAAGISLDLGSSLKADNPDAMIDFSAQPNQTGSTGGLGLFDNLLWDNRLFTVAGDDLAFHVSNLPAGTYRVYTLTREPAQLNRTHDLSLGAIPGSDVANGVEFGDPGLTQQQGEVSADNGDSMDLLSDYFFNQVTIDGTNTDLVGIIRPVDDSGEPNLFGAITGLQIIDERILPTRGDADGDGDVDIDDYILVRDNFFSDGTNPVGTNGGEVIGAVDGSVDILDFTTWRSAFEAAGGTLAGSVFSVPEPSCLSIMFAGALIGMNLNRRQRNTGC